MSPGIARIAKKYLYGLNYFQFICILTTNIHKPTNIQKRTYGVDQALLPYHPYSDAIQVLPDLMNVRLPTWQIPPDFTLYYCSACSFVLRDPWAAVR